VAENESKRAEKERLLAEARMREEQIIGQQKDRFI